MDKQNLRMEILSKVESGDLPLETAARLLSEIDRVEGSSPEVISAVVLPQEEVSFEPQQVELEKPGWSIILWLTPLLLGVILTASTAYRLYQKLSINGTGTGFWFLLIPLGVGIFLIYLGWDMQNSKWIYIDVQQPVGEKPQRILLSFPLPFRFVGKLIQLFDKKLPQSVQKFNLQAMLLAIDEQTDKNDPVFINVDDEDGTRVKIYLG